jgi:hypothetical protein
MYKKLSKKSMLLFGAVLALCAFAMPSVASASTWDPPSTTHTLDSPNLSFTSAAGGSTCALAQFHVVVSAAGVSTITGTNFANCSGTAPATPCVTTPRGTNFPWTVTPISATTVTIDKVHVDVTYEGIGCPLGNPSGNVTLSGNLGPAAWSNATHEVVFASTGGLTVAGVGPATVSGTVRDTSQTLAIT